MGAMIPMGKNQSKAKYLHKIKLMKVRQIKCVTYGVPGLKRR